MWQTLVAAAVAGTTGIVAKHFFKPGADPDHAQKPYDGDDFGVQATDRDEEPRFLSASALGSELDLPLARVSEEEDEIFRFSSKGPSRPGSRNLSRRKAALSKGMRAERSAGLEKRSGVRRFGGICLKRRKTCKNVAGKRESCSSNDTSLFGWGLGVGIMYMMSTGKVEFGRLNAAVSETAKVVNELKAELHKRKSSPSVQVPGCARPAILAHHTTSYEVGHPDLNESRTNKIAPNDVKCFNDGECASSVLTEEPAPGMQEMDQLEAELELELQKLPWCTLDASNQEGSNALVETELSVQGFPEHEGQDSESQWLCGNGILPAELDQKLCHLLIERQENQIEELESELHLAQHKLHEKEAELRALKDCVKRLTEFSLSTCSDDETEAEMEQDQTSGWNYKKVGSESKKPGVGMKRPID